MNINLDINATWKIDEELWLYLHDTLEGALNPSSVHQGGQRARYLIEEAREDIKALVDAKDSRLIFTSGATEANNLMLRSAARVSPRPDFIVSAIEHPSLLECARRLAQEGARLTVVMPEPHGGYSLRDFLPYVGQDTTFISVMTANNENGDLLPIAELTSHAKSVSEQIFIHSDAVQAIGKVDFSFTASMLDGITISAHKIGGLMGCGALIVRGDAEILPAVFGGPQENRLRAGTENLAGIVAFGYAAKKRASEGTARREKMLRGREILLSALSEKISGLTLNQFAEKQLPNTLNLRIPGVRADDLVVALDLQQIYVSSAAACSSGKPLPSHVLLAYGLSEDEARNSIRISLDGSDSDEMLRDAALKIASVVEHMRGGTKTREIKSIEAGYVA